MATQEKVKKEVEKSKIVTVWDYLEKRKGEIAKVLPSHMTPDRLIGVMSYVIKSAPAVMQASQMSLISAVIQTVQIGLEPGNLGHCYYVPFFNAKRGVKEVQFILGYKGIIELVNRAGKAVILSAEVVREKDKFRFAQGLNPILEHIPSNETDRGEIRGVYCVAKNIVANEKLFVYLTKEDIEKVRRASKASKSEYSPWNTWYEEMAKKTAVKRICKLLPLSVEVQKQVSTDETTKTKIEKDMTVLPDETDWSNGAIEGEIVKDKVEKKPEKDKDTPSDKDFKEDDSKAADMSDELGKCKTEADLNKKISLYVETITKLSDQAKQWLQDEIESIRLRVKDKK